MRWLALILLLAVLPATAEAHHRCWHKQDACATATPTPTPTATSTPTPTPTATPVATATPEPTPEPTTAPLFVDEFDGPAGAAPNPDYWSPYCCAPTGSTQTPGAARLDGQGNLEIVVRDSTQAGAIETKGKVMLAPPFTAEAVVKWPASYQLWHSFWWVGGGWDSAGELDLYENGGLTYYQSCAHEWAEGVHLSAWCESHLQPSSDATANWHVYGARVAAGMVAYTLDGVTVATHALTGRFEQPGGFLFSLWPANCCSPTGFPATLKVARIEVRAE